MVHSEEAQGRCEVARLEQTHCEVGVRVAVEEWVHYVEEGVERVQEKEREER